jgi:hypothetical protein
MRIATERRGNVWLAQVTHIGSDLHWTEHRRRQVEMIDWVETNTSNQVDIDGWQFFFHAEQDLMLFLLRWNGHDTNPRRI